MSQQEKLRGVAVSPGFAFAQAHLVARGMPKVPRYSITPDHLQEEKKRFLDALDHSYQQLDGVRKRLTEEGINKELIYILDAHMLILEDKMLREGTLAIIDQKVNAEWAVLRYLTNIIAVFQRMDDHYLREKKADIEQVGKQIINNLMGNKIESIGDFPHPVILVSEEFSPSDTLLMNHKTVLGFVTQWGGRTSHTAIMAKSLDIPAIVGAPKATSLIKQGDPLVLDGVAGCLYVNPTQDTIHHYESRLKKFRHFRSRLLQNKTLPATTPDGHTLLLKANVELGSDIKGALEVGADGIGLYRTDYLYMNRSTLPDEMELYHIFKNTLQAMGKRPVTIRTMDIGGEKQSDVFGYQKSHKAVNPALGLHSIRLCLKEQTPAFITQLRALLRASIHGKLHILFPMISGVPELKEALQLLKKVKQDLKEEGTPFDKKILVGCMVEVPAAALCADQLAKWVDFLSIGTNDLIQFTLAVDRVDESVAYLYEPAHPAVLRLIKTTVMAANAANIPVTLCGEMAGDPRYVMLLMGLGLNELSVVPGCLPLVRRTIQGIHYQQAVKLVQSVLVLDDSLAIVKEVEKVMRSVFTEDHIFH